MKLPENAAGNLIRNAARKWFTYNNTIKTYGKKRHKLEVRSLMNYFGNPYVAILKGSEYEPMIGIMPPVRRVLDVGANNGNLLFWLAEHDFCTPDVQYVGIEPDPETFAQLNRNLERNGYCCAKTINAAVVTSGARDVEFQQSTVNNASGLIRKHDAPGEWRTIRVPALNLATLSERFDFVSIDIEGGEFDLLATPLPRCVAEAPWVVIEWHEPFSDLIYLRSRMLPIHKLVSYKTYDGGLGNAFFTKIA